MWVKALWNNTSAMILAHKHVIRKRCFLECISNFASVCVIKRTTRQHLDRIVNGQTQRWPSCVSQIQGSWRNLAAQINFKLGPNPSVLKLSCLRTCHQLRFSSSCHRRKYFQFTQIQSGPNSWSNSPMCYMICKMCAVYEITRQLMHIIFFIKSIMGYIKITIKN